jgi:hypothetical protein
MAMATRFTDLQAMFSADAARSAGATYIARSDKARRELGWQTRPLQTGMLETFEWIAMTEDKRSVNIVRGWEEKIGRLALLAAVILLLVWLFGRRPKKDK